MELETIKYWRTIPPHIDSSQINDLAIYKNDSEELVSRIEERYSFFVELINKMIRENNSDISNRMFRNSLFRASVERTHAGIMHTIESANERIQHEAEEATARLEEHQRALQAAIEENQQNAVAVIEEQDSIVSESRDILNAAIQEARTAMEQTTEQVQQQCAELETRLAEYKDMRKQTAIDVHNNINKLKDYKTETKEIAISVVEFAKELNQQIKVFNNTQTPVIADFKLDISKIMSSSAQIKEINTHVLSSIKT